LSAERSIAKKHSNKVTGSGVAFRYFARPQAHVDDGVQVIAHHRPCMNATGENFAKFQNACLHQDRHPGSSVLEAFASVIVQAAKPRSAHAAIDAVKGAGLGRVNELAARLGHGRSL